MAIREDEDFMEQRSSTATLALVPARYEELSSAKTLAWKRWVVIASLAFSDVLLALMLWGAAYVLRAFWGHAALSEATIVSVMPITAAWVALRALLGLYPGYGLDSVAQLRRHTHATFVALAILAIFAVGFHVGNMLSRLLLALVFLGLLVLAPFVRRSVRWGAEKLGAWGEPVVVLGYKEAGAEAVDLLRERRELGYDPVAIFDYCLGPPGRTLDNVDDERVMAGVVDLAREHDVDTTVFAMPHARREQLSKLVGLASLHFRNVLVIPNLKGITNSAVVARDLGGMFAVEIKYNLLDPWALRAKRIMDLVFTVTGGVLILPFLLVLALLVYLESGWPVLYCDRRMGKDNQLFSCWKFRTMVSNAEALLQEMLEEDDWLREEYAKYHKLRNDPRVTRVGNFLRKTSLDELPQLWNVLRGEMSLVGPRPYLPRESEEIGVSQIEILRVPPGITGPWQVSGRNHAFFSDRVRMDAHYVREWSVWLDLVLLASTIKSVVLGRGAY